MVSLIMPAWQPRPEWLRAAVGSALDEPDADVELIVVDDGSDEPVADILADWGDPRLRVMRVAHGGPYAARNAAITATRGEYVRFVDADDLVEPGSTGRLLALAREGDEALAYGATMMCDQELRPQRLVRDELEGWVAPDCVTGAFDVYVVSILFPRAVIERIGPWDERGFAVSGDWDYVLRALEAAPARCLGEIVTHYRRHDRSVTRGADVAAGAAAGRRVIERYFERNPEQVGGELERRAYARLHLDRARAYAWTGQRGPAVRELGAALRRDPSGAVASWARWAAGRARALGARRG